MVRDRRPQKIPWLAIGADQVLREAVGWHSDGPRYQQWVALWMSRY